MRKSVVEAAGQMELTRPLLIQYIHTTLICQNHLILTPVVRLESIQQKLVYMVKALRFTSKIKTTAVAMTMARHCLNFVSSLQNGPYASNGQEKKGPILWKESSCLFC